MEPCIRLRAGELQHRDRRTLKAAHEDEGSLKREGGWVWVWDIVLSVLRGEGSGRGSGRGSNFLWRVVHISSAVLNPQWS